MKQRNRPGSAVLIIVLVMAAAVVWCLNTFKSFSFTMEMALKRQEWEQTYRMTEGVLKYGIWLCKTRFATLEQLVQGGYATFELPMGTWQVTAASPAYTGKLTLAMSEARVELRASLHRGSICACSLSCTVERVADQQDNKKTVFVVKNWRQGA